MGLEIVKVLNDSDGNPNKEVVILRATVGGVNLADYGFQDNTYSKDGKLSNLQRHFFQLPKLVLKEKGDTVYVYTGQRAERTITADYITYLHTLEDPLFLNLEHCIWNNEGDKIQLFRITLVDEMPVK